MIDSKVVPFAQGADFLHARGMKLKRSGNWLDALDLLRRAQENAPDGEDYRMDIADVYAGMNCPVDSRAMAILHILRKPEADAYFQLGKYAAELGALPEAEKAYEQFLRHCEDPERAGEVREELNDIRTAYGMWRQVDRSTRRRVRRLRQVRRCQFEQDYAGADEIYARELKSTPDDVQVRVNRAMNLTLMGETEAAQAEMDRAFARLAEYPSGIIILAAQVYHRIGDDERADQTLSLLQKSRMAPQDWQMLMALQADMCRDEAAYQAGSEALKHTPYDKRMLHLMAVTAARLGREESVIAGYWQRILRVDPKDDVAQYHLQQLRDGKLNAAELRDAYQLPAQERLMRGQTLLDLMNMPREAIRQAWTDSTVRRALHWAILSENRALAEPAIRILTAIGEKDCMLLLGEFIARTRLDMDIRLHALRVLRQSNAQEWQGVGDYVQMQMIPGYQEALDHLPAPYRQTVRMTKDYLDAEYGVQADVAPALQCAEYLSRCSGGFNRMLDLRCGAAALAVIELRAAGRNDSLEDVARRFDCSVRKLKYYVEYLGNMPDERE